MRKVLLPNHYTVYVYVKCVYAPFMLLNGQEDQKNVSQYFKRFFSLFFSLAYLSQLSLLSSYAWVQPGNQPCNDRYHDLRSWHLESGDSSSGSPPSCRLRRTRRTGWASAWRRGRGIRGREPRTSADPTRAGLLLDHNWKAEKIILIIKVVFGALKRAFCTMCVTDLGWRCDLIIFGSILTTFESNIFWGSWVSIKIWLQPKTKFSLSRSEKSSVRTCM